MVIWCSCIREHIKIRITFTRKSTISYMSYKSHMPMGVNFKHYLFCHQLSPALSEPVYNNVIIFWKNIIKQFQELSMTDLLKMAKMFQM